MLKAAEPVDVPWHHLMPRDDQDVIGQLAAVEVFQHSERVWPHYRQERVCCPVEELDRRQMRLEVPMVHQLPDRFGVGHEGARLALVPQAVGVADAVRAVQRATLDVSG